MFTIQNQISGKTFQINATDALLQGAINHGINFPYGCRQGFCGKCKAVILAGEVRYDGDTLPKGISPEEQADGMALLCQCKAKSDVVLAVAELDSVSDIACKTLPCKVEKITRLNHDVAQIFLKIPGAETLQYLAGQYIDLIHPEFEPRAFSIANAPSNSSLIELHVRLVDDGKFTHFVFNELAEKSLLKIEGPKGDFYLRENQTNPIILVAGGTGFAPVKAIIEHAIATEIPREIHLYWGVRDTMDFYLNLPEKWSAEHPNIHFTPVLSEPNATWKGATGYVHQRILQDFSDLGNCEIYACGPPAMVKAAAQTFAEKGMNPKQFFSDAFEFAFSKK